MCLPFAVFDSQTKFYLEIIWTDLCRSSQSLSQQHYAASTRLSAAIYEHNAPNNRKNVEDNNILQSTHIRVTCRYISYPSVRFEILRRFSNL